MRQHFMIALLVAFSASHAQQTSTPRSKMVARAADDAAVNLLGESESGVRIKDERASACAKARINGQIPRKQALIVDSGLAGSLALPDGWVVNELPSSGFAPSATGMRLIARLSKPSSQRIDLQGRVSIWYGDQDGFPKAVLMEGTTVESTVECRTSLSSSQTASLIRASATTPDKGQITYVAGYAKLGDGRWISFLGSSARPDDAEEFVAIFTSVSARKSK